MNTFEMPFDLSFDQLLIGKSAWERDFHPRHDFSDLEAILADDARKALKRANFEVDPTCKTFQGAKAMLKDSLPETRLVWLRRHVPACACCAAATSKARERVFEDEDFLDETDDSLLPGQENLFNPLPMGSIEQ